MSETRRASNVIYSEVREQAASWFERVHAEDADVGDFLEFQIWLNSSDAHTVAFRGLEDLVEVAWQARGIRWVTAKELSSGDNDEEL